MTRRPNILFLMTDQQRWDAMGCSGGWVRSPNLDRIAADGVRFDEAFTNSPVCRPARVSLATGLYPRHLALWGNQKDYELSPDQPTWMRTIREAGYRTSLFGKTHLHPQHGDLRDREDLLHAYGLDDVDELAGPRAATVCRSNLTDLWEREGLYEVYRDDMRKRQQQPWKVRPTPLPLELYPDVYVGRRATAYLRDYDRDEPWFCWVSFPGPHEPWDAPEPYASMHRPEDMPPPIVPSAGDENGRPRGQLDRRLTKRFPFEEGDVARMRADYAGKVALIDEQIGRILEAVEQRGELQDTVVAFVSDHGEMNGDWGLVYKQNFLDGAVRIPFLLSAPRMPGGVVSEALVELMDLGATLVELAGATSHAGSLAKSLVPVLEHPEREHRPFAISEFQREVMVVTHEHKLGLTRQGKPYLLFDRRNDPTERSNVVSDPAYREVRQALRRRAPGIAGARPQRSLPRRALGKLRRMIAR